MKTFYSLSFETKKEDRSYSLNIPLGVSFDEVKQVLIEFNSMCDELLKKAQEAKSKLAKEESDQNTQVESDTLPIGG